MAPNLKGLQNFMCMPQRYILGIMCSTAVVNAYTMRNCLSVAMTEMVVKRKGESIMDKEHLYTWDDKMQGLIHGSFYWGYIVTHIPGGILAEKFGGKYALSLGILSTAILTLITPVALQYGDWPVLLVTRILEGLGEGSTFPALNVLLSKWVPPHERGKIGTMVFSGTIFGSVAANLCTGYIIEATGTWASPFYLFGALGILWFILFTLLCFSTPLDHPFISDKELDFLKKELEGLNKEKHPTPWVAILTSSPVWAMVIAEIGHDWGLFAMVTNLPKYMQETLDFSVSQNGLWSSVPYILMWVVAVINGAVVDWLILKNYMSTTFARKFYTTIGAVIPGLLIVAASYAEDNVVLTIVCFTLAMGTMGFYYAGLRVNALDITTNYGGTVMALENGFGALCGIVTPVVIGVIISEGGDRLFKWRIFFWITLGVFIVTGIWYIVFASGVLQPWDNPTLYNEQRNADKAVKDAAKAERKAAKAERKAAKAAAKAGRA